MTPFSFEWQWNVEYLIFMGLLYLALTIVGGGLIYTWIKTWLSLSSSDKKDDSTANISYRSGYSKY